MKRFAGEELFWGEITHRDENLIFQGDDIDHILKVMRHKIGDRIFITEGDGSIIEVLINQTDHEQIECKLIATHKIENRLSQIEIAIPRLKSNDKIKFCLEKLVETGFSRFVFYESDFTVGKGFKVEQWRKTAIAAAKQSFNPFAPEIQFVPKFDSLFDRGSKIIGFDLEAGKSFADFTPDPTTGYILITGPEGGLSRRELAKFEKENLFHLTQNRLRSETAVLYSAFNLSRFYLKQAD
ncbi:MAG: 16S rRNA (uracil(1498)-N(3))-methyltransferase [Ignavibacteriales bacterium]|nr:MAG: 16S rRNA (uracil(1498)-N(3))-methyltransferase [Ignavibacteriaceae bacterium]MBW7874230.1 16S rRNA (uracil(1498)-N(3))-methyltransferase [Ignavibacteria bacterium]MCZ2142298.1 16S rRNA (uracil(1498)-N(3))-methyltransferase [Ignavibacteriales bacterium]OQY76428.1 MAG: hypothetical protein B6D45_03455 [Ignavibacteriales bacterium UTCHB3]MBV6445182.1 Ribosomal RNA small subunit methyltransferase E [Ignavibacteriaceae bacterium]